MCKMNSLHKDTRKVTDYRTDAEVRYFDENALFVGDFTVHIFLKIWHKFLKKKKNKKEGGTKKNKFYHQNN